MVEDEQNEAKRVAAGLTAGGDESPRGWGWPFA